VKEEVRRGEALPGAGAWIREGPAVKGAKGGRGRRSRRISGCFPAGPAAPGRITALWGSGCSTASRGLICSVAMLDIKLLRDDSQRIAQNLADRHVRVAIPGQSDREGDDWAARRPRRWSRWTASTSIC
jgi:hypothetical protein